MPTDQHLHLVTDISIKALIEHEGRILIVFDRGWELPGGRLHVDEQPEEALHREVMEELGVNVEILSLYDGFPFIGLDGKRHFNLIYRCRLLDPTAPLKPDGQELTDMRWISREDDLSQIDFFPSYQKSLKKYFDGKMVG